MLGCSDLRLPRRDLTSGPRLKDVRGINKSSSLMLKREPVKMTTRVTEHAFSNTTLITAFANYGE